jgi:hypothetical protein
MEAPSAPSLPPTRLVLRSKLILNHGGSKDRGCGSRFVLALSCFQTRLRVGCPLLAMERKIYLAACGFALSVLPTDPVYFRRLRSAGAWRHRVRNTLVLMEPECT